MNSQFQASIKHLNGTIPQIGTVTTFSFFGGEEPVEDDTEDQPLLSSLKNVRPDDTPASSKDGM